MVMSFDGLVSLLVILSFFFSCMFCWSLFNYFTLYIRECVVIIGIYIYRICKMNLLYLIDLIIFFLMGCYTTDVLGVECVFLCISYFYFPIFYFYVRLLLGFVRPHR